MTRTQAKVTSSPKPPRVWPGVILATLQFLMWFVLDRFFPEQGMYWFFGAALCAAAIVVWWALFSRAPRAERAGFVLLMAAALYATWGVLHVSVSGAGMGMLFLFYSLPPLTMLFVAAVAAGRRLSTGARRALMAAAILAATGVWALLRIDGIRAAGGPDYAWRWSPTPEQRLLAADPHEPEAAAQVPAAGIPQVEPSVPAGGAAEPARPAAAPEAEGALWSGFRGPQRDGIARGARMATDWAASPPVEMWRRAVGPGWSSFAVRGDFFYTQEQRGEDEVVACYRLSTGELVWRHRDATRFWEANAGPGPRATPTLSGGRVYALGATGILNALDAATGAVAWSRSVSADAGVETPHWGFASSPLVVGNIVVVAASGRLAAYDAAHGELRWLGPSGRQGYASPHLVTIAGVEQIVLLSGSGAASVAPADGAVLWQHEWPGAGMLQPALAAEGELLITTAGMNGGEGTRRIAVARTPAGWTVEERWTSRGLKPYFNDLVVHRGHAYGFDGGILACIDLNDGARKWKGGRYGHGQLILLPAQDALLVLSEQGELALVAARPDQHTELARFPALDGKTWNHPVLAGDVLLVRNDREMAAFRMPRASR